MGSEDFGFFSRKLPGLLVRLGMGSGSALLHTGGFDFNDRSLAAGMTILLGLVLRSTEPAVQVSA